MTLEQKLVCVIGYLTLIFLIVYAGIKIINFMILDKFKFDIVSLTIGVALGIQLSFYFLPWFKKYYLK